MSIETYTDFEIYRSQQLSNGMKEVRNIEQVLHKEGEGFSLMYPNPDVTQAPLYIDKVTVKAIKGGLLGVYNELAETQRETAEGICLWTRENLKLL